MQEEVEGRPFPLSTHILFCAAMTLVALPMAAATVAVDAMTWSGMEGAVT